MEPNELLPVVQPAHELSTAGVYDRISDPMSAIKTLGRSIFLSGIFGLDKPEQGEILAMQCLVEKKSPLELARTYHFIQGQLAIRSDALLAKFHQAGGSVDWTERTDEKVKATFRKGASSADIVADLKEYVGNGTALGKDKPLPQPDKLHSVRVDSLSPAVALGLLLFGLIGLAVPRGVKGF